MTWKELCEKAKEIGYDKHFCNMSECEYVEIGGTSGEEIRFYEDGDITLYYKDISFYWNRILRNNRTPDQMWQIMQALEEC